MAFNISFSFDSELHSTNLEKAFISPNGEEYVVNVQRSKERDFGYYGKNSTITLSWKRNSSRFVRLKIYWQSESNPNLLDDFNIFASDKQLTTSQELYLNTNPGQIFILINVYPYDDISKCLNVPTTSKVKQNVTKVEPIKEKRLEHLSSDLESLLQTGLLSDVTLTDGSKEIHAHKLILSVRSSVFSKMFQLQHPMKENKENRITIKDISIEVLKSLLNFMYTGTIVLSDMKMARNLYIASDKYDVKNLKNICSEMLKSVNSDSVLDTLLLADLYQDTQLKQAALNFISNNYSHLKTLSDWNKFMKENQSLAIEILSFVVDRKV